MASSSSHAPERSKVEQIVVEFFAKSLHIILESRIPALGGESDYLGSSASSSNSGPKTRDRWFNLALGDCTAALENFEPWRRSLSDPMVVDILLYNSSVIESKPSGPPVGTSEHLSWEKAGTSLEHEDSSMVNKPTTLERWTVQFDQRKRTNAFSSSQALKVASRVKQATGRDAGRLGSGETHEAQVDTKKEDAVSGLRLQKVGVDESRGKGEASLPAHVTEVSAVYKRTVIMLRSLYSTCRLLPAYRIFKMSSSSTNCCDFYLDYRMLSTVTPLTEHDNRDMSVFSFTPVETAFGRMSLSVQYRLSTSVIELRVVPSILPRIIPDYVGSPTTDPLKRFTGEPHSLPASGMCLGQGMHLIALRSSLQNSPPYPGLDRRHSWSGRIHQMQPALQPPSSPSYRISRSPSPSYPFHPSPPHTPSYSPLSCKQQCSDLSPSPITSPHSSADRHTGIGIKASQPISIDRHLSPPFSPSPSPSPPTLYRGSDPVSIPRPSQLRGSKLSLGDPHQRSSRNLLPPLSPSSRKAGVILRSSSESPRHSGHLLHALQSRSFESSSQLQTLHGDRCNQVSYLCSF
ncbi:hypothetical protein KP509_29G066100 [Ceratopteris richardii]|uniref:Autophagy-related protein 13 N-terminal domain-containing protein n=1 Tax=Ceratopteris richardii TaxID=49495 RepID=A0A8T2R9E9_CERRI|nr:hypothetical protein KP509_29G066100 [Ceratopteris richardii]